MESVPGSEQYVTSIYLGCRGWGFLRYRVCRGYLGHLGYLSYYLGLPTVACHLGCLKSPGIPGVSLCTWSYFRYRFRWVPEVICDYLTVDA